MANKNPNSKDDKKISGNSKNEQTITSGAKRRRGPARAAKKAAPKKKYIAILGISLAVLLCTFFVAMGFGFTSYLQNSPKASPEVSEEPEIKDDLLAPVDKATGKINILLLGVDVEGLRTDTMIIASYDLDNNNIKLLSIPRDTRMYIGKKYQKINAAHAITQSGNIKGPQGSIEAVTRLTGIPINYYVEFSFEAFRNTIDSLGGVYFDVPQNMDYEDPVQDLYIHLDKGYQLLDGDKAEQLVRFRRYPMGDIARVETQQAFIKAFFEQKLKPETLKDLPDLFKQWQKDINTNFTILDITKLVPNIMDLSTEDITMYSVPGNYNDTDYGASYWIADMEELKELIETEFDYDASKITTHSSDGASKSKDKKKSSTTKATQKPSATDEAENATAAPTKTPSTNVTPKSTEKPLTHEIFEEAPTADPKEKYDDIPVSTMHTNIKPVNTPSVNQTKKPTLTNPPVSDIKDKVNNVSNKQNSDTKTDKTEIPSKETISDNITENEKANAVKPTAAPVSEKTAPVQKQDKMPVQMPSANTEEKQAVPDTEKTIIKLD